MTNFTGPSSRRVFLRTSLGTGAAVVAGAVVARRAAAQEKVEPSLVQYQAMPKDGLKCSGCQHFVAPNACAVVAGEISPNGWCAAYAAKES